MKRWNIPDMLDIGRKLFAKVYKKNQGVHFDIRHFNHLIGSKHCIEEAKNNLKNRIEATIGCGSFNLPKNV